MEWYFTNHRDIENVGLSWEYYIDALDEEADKGIPEALDALRVLAVDYTTSVRMVLGVERMEELGLKPYSF
jgi:hypothetical protein